MLKKKDHNQDTRAHANALSMTDLVEDIQPQMSIYYLLN